MTLDELAELVAQMAIGYTVMSERVDRVTALATDVVERASTRIAALVEHVDRVTAERDYAVAVADSLRASNERLERELSDAVRRLVETRNAPHGNR